MDGVVDGVHPPPVEELESPTLEKVRLLRPEMTLDAEGVRRERFRRPAHGNNWTAQGGGL